MCKTSSKKAKENQFHCAENVLPICDLIPRLPSICGNVMVRVVVVVVLLVVVVVVVVMIMVVVVVVVVVMIMVVVVVVMVVVVVYVLVTMLFSRPGQSQGLFYKHLCD